MFRRATSHLKLKEFGLRWTQISWFSNSPFAKSTLLIPFVAQYVILSRKYLEENWGYEHAIILYWSLILLSSGQFLYSIFSPRTIKKYGDDKEQFVEHALNTYDEGEYRKLYTQYLRSFFKETGGDKFNLHPPGETFEVALSKALKNYNANAEKFHGVTALIRDIQKNVPTDARSGFNNVVLRNSLHDVFQAERDLVSFNEFMHAVNHSPKNQNMKIFLLNWKFKRENESKSNIVALCGILIGCGSVYFLWNFARNIFIVLQLTLF